jgi:hypothetical protein
MAEPIVIKFYSPVNEGGLAHEIRSAAVRGRSRSHLDPGRWLTGRTR